MRQKNRIPALAAVSTLFAFAGLAAAQIQVANFDSHPEGFAGTSYMEGGLTFHDMDPRIPGSPPPGSLNFEDSSANLTGIPGYSSPNTLTFNGYSPGPGASFGRIGSLTITPSGQGTHASIEVFDFFSYVGNTMIFAAYLNGQEVARDSAPILGGGINHTHLEVSATFDNLKLFGEGPNDQGVFFGSIDNVMVSNGGELCYANCDQSTTPPILNVNDFICFQSKFAAGDTYANCDLSTTPPVLNVNDFICFQTRFAEGCH